MRTLGTHVPAGIVASWLAAWPLFGHSYRLTDVVGIAMASIAAAAPDFDTRLGWEHRGATHSILAMLVVAAAAWLLSLIGPNVALVAFMAAVAYISHPALDLFATESHPVALFWPSDNGSVALDMAPQSSVWEYRVMVSSWVGIGLILIAIIWH
jgi:membrane-bound metal-dependent hydrolase YbcI (DUF457 family)